MIHQSTIMYCYMFTFVFRPFTKGQAQPPTLLALDFPTIRQSPFSRHRPLQEALYRQSTETGLFPDCLDQIL